VSIHQNVTVRKHGKAVSKTCKPGYRPQSIGSGDGAGGASTVHQPPLSSCSVFARLIPDFVTFQRGRLELFRETQMKHTQLIAALLCAVSPFAHAETSNQIDEVVVTATRFLTSSTNSPINVKIITATDIENNAAQSLPALLAQYAGVNVRSTDGTADMAIDLRGFGMTGGQNTLVLLDGQKLNDNELTSIRWSAIPLASIERIEIINGGGSVLYGAGASGGTINIITKHPNTKLKGTASIGVGSYAAKDWQVALAGTNETIGMHVTASGLNSDNYRVNNAIKQNNVEADLRTEAGHGEAILKVGADNQDLRYPGSRTVNPNSGVNELVSAPQGTSTPLDYGTRTGSHVSLGTTQLLEFGEFASEISYRKKNQQAYFDASGGSYLDTNSNLLSFSPRIKVPLKLSKINNELIIGFDFDNWDYNSRRSSSPSTINTPSTQILATQLNRGAYFQNTANLSNNTKLLLGARSQTVDYQSRDTTNSAAYASGAQTDNVNAYELGLRQNLNQTVAVFGRIGRSFRIATVDEIFNQYGACDQNWFCTSTINMLKPQTSEDKELGIDYTSLTSTLRATAFQMNLNNEIHYNALTFTNMNLSPTTRYGLELEGMNHYGEILNVRAAYTYTVAKFREGIYGGVDVTGNNIPLVPKHHISVSVSWKIHEKTTLNSVANYVGEQYFDNDQANTFSTKMPAYSTVDMKLSHQEGHWLTTGSINNIFDQQYFTYGVASNFTPGKFNAYPMQGRNIFINLQYQY
jgi:iron complex outermembrane receptor protein